MASIEQVYRTSDGEIFDSEYDAETHQGKLDFENRLQKMVEGENGVAYVENQHMVVEFIMDNFSALKEMFEEVY